MRVTSAVTSVSWIPSSAVTGAWKVPFTVGIDHDDRPRPDVVGDIDDLPQTAGGRTAAPAPRRNRPPYVQIVAPTAWTTLILTMHADGFAHGELVGASPSHAIGYTTTPVRWLPSWGSPTSRRGPVTTINVPPSDGPRDKRLPPARLPDASL